jgi:hypothetical protein
MHLIVLRDPKFTRTNGEESDLQVAAFPDESRVRDPVLLDGFTVAAAGSRFFSVLTRW